MFNCGDSAIITASKEMLQGVGADWQLKECQLVNVIKTYPDGWAVVEDSIDYFIDGKLN